MARRVLAWWRCHFRWGGVAPIGTKIEEPVDHPPPYSRHIDTSDFEGQIGNSPPVNVTISPGYEDELACLFRLEHPVHVLAVAAAVREGCTAAAETVVKMFLEGRFVHELEVIIHEGRSRVAEAVLTAAAAAPGGKERATAVIAASAITKVAYQATENSSILMVHSAAAVIASTAYGMVANIAAFGALGNYRLSDVPRPALTSVFTQKQEPRGAFPY